MVNIFLILGELILLMFLFFAIVGIEKIKIEVAMQVIVVNIKYCLLNVLV